MNLAKLVHVDGKKITFSKDIVDYIKNDSDNVVRLVESYKNKNKVYKKSKENISKGLVNNYREEIKSICGTSSGERWVEIYKMFSKTFPNFLKDYTKYVEKHKGEGKYDISKVRYVVDVMNQGNVLLKIACELYVN